MVDVVKFPSQGLIGQGKSPLRNKSSHCRADGTFTLAALAILRVSKLSAAIVNCKVSL